MPIYQVGIEIDHPTNAKELITHVEYLDAVTLIDAAKEAEKHAKVMEGDLKSVFYATPDPIKVVHK
jgi:hypothetical protein